MNAIMGSESDRRALGGAGEAARREISSPPGAMASEARSPDARPQDAPIAPAMNCRTGKQSRIRMELVAQVVENL